MSSPRVSWVVLTMGDRPIELAAAVASIEAQRGDSREIIVVGNGAEIEPPSDAVTTLATATNLGIPGGRNVGIESATGEIICFLDDDAVCADPGIEASLLEAFDGDPTIGIISMRLQDPVDGSTARRHVPRLRVGDPHQSGEVTTFLGGASAVRSVVIKQCGALPARFGYALEETDLAWRAVDDGWRVMYRGDLVIEHPNAAPTRHPEFFHHTARNRVWLARRRLPWPLAALYLTIWTGLTVARNPDLGAVRHVFAGTLRGVREPAGERSPMSWRTVWRMTRLGRPPII